MIVTYISFTSLLIILNLWKGNESINSFEMMQPEIFFNGIRLLLIELKSVFLLRVLSTPMYCIELAKSKEMLFEYEYIVSAKMPVEHPNSTI